MPEDTEFPLIRSNPLQGFDRVVHAEILMILGDQFNQSASGFLEQREVLDDV